MRTLKPNTPFPVTGYFGPDYFCNRDQETKQLINACKSGVNITLFSIRRIGKTGLIKHLYHHLHLKSKTVTIYLDIQGTSCFSDFVDAVAGAVIQACDENTNYGKKILKFMRSFNPLITIDPLTGIPQASIQFNSTSHQENSLKNILRLIDEQKFRTVIAIDEFQQIDNYPEKNTEALLRSEIQHLKNTSFIFSGSQQHLLADMFGNAKRPFFASSQMVKLDKLSEADYAPFIAKKFDQVKIAIDSKEINQILQWTKCYTFYTQFLCNRLYLINKKKITSKLINEVMYSILKENETLYYNYRDILTTAQWKFISALAKESRVYSPTSGQFIATYDLKTPAMVKRSLDSLLEKEMIYKDTDSEGKNYYEVYDLFLSRWLERL